MISQFYIPTGKDLMILEKLLAESLGIKRHQLRESIRAKCISFFRIALYNYLFTNNVEETVEERKEEVLCLWTDSREDLESVLSGFYFVVKSRNIDSPAALKSHMENLRLKSKNLLSGKQGSFIVKAQ